MRHQRRTWAFLAPVAGMCVLGYFLYHTIEGERGWVEQKHLENEVTDAQARLDKLRAEREQLEHRVRLMRPDSMDPDLLDEMSRKMLNYSKPGEIVVLSPEDQDKKTPPQNR